MKLKIGVKNVKLDELRLMNDKIAGRPQDYYNRFLPASWLYLSGKSETWWQSPFRLGWWLWGTHYLWPVQDHQKKWHPSVLTHEAASSWISNQSPLQFDYTNVQSDQLHEELPVNHTDFSGGSTSDTICRSTMWGCLPKKFLTSVEYTYNHHYDLQSWCLVPEHWCERPCRNMKIYTTRPRDLWRQHIWQSRMMQANYLRPSQALQALCFPQQQRR